MAVRRFNSSCQLQIAVDIESYCLKRARGRYHGGKVRLRPPLFDVLNVCFWHKADIEMALRNVRFWE
jgi:hypothetical protein